MKKPDRPKSNEIGWVFAFLFPKKSKPLTKPGVIPVNAPPAQASTAPAPVSVASAPSASPPVTKAPAAKPATEAKSNAIFQPGKLLPAFWTVASGLSFIVNIILIVVLIILGQQLFSLKKLVGQNLIGGLYSNFILMDLAHIKTNIVVEDTIPVQFSLPISQQITVTLTEDTVIRNALVGILSAPTTVTLPAGTKLPIQLNLTVPVNTTIPIKLNVPVDIPLQQTDLHTPFIGLQGVVSPFYNLLQPGIKGLSDIPACQPANWFCNALDEFFVK